MSHHTPYLQRRRDSFYFRIAIPVALRSLLGAAELTKALSTTDKQVAIPRALQLAARVKATFHVIVSEMAKKKPSGSSFEINYGLTVDLDALTGKATIVLSDAKSEDQDAISANIKTVMDGVSQTLQAARAEVRPATASVVVAEDRALRDVLPIWQKVRSVSRATVEVYAGAVKRFESRYPDLAVERITPEHIDDYVDWLQKIPLAPKSIEKEHGAIRALLNVAAKKARWIKTNPAIGTMLPKIRGSGRPVRSYTIDELSRIFSSPVFVDGKRPKAGKGEAAKWIPLLLLFTGARRDEIGQLTTNRVLFSEGVNYIAIDPVDDDGSLKTDESKRNVPLHARLVELGFMEYVEAIRKSGGGLLFPVLKKNARGQYAAKWGDWWSRYIRGTVGITDKAISPAHSFRHLFITECRRLKFRQDYERALVGHTKSGSQEDAHDRYGEYDLPALSAELNRIDFRGLNLSMLISGK